MTLPATGTISMSDILAELRVADAGRTYPVSLLDADVRTLAGRPTGNVSMPNDFYGKSSYVAMSGSIPDVDDHTPVSTGSYTFSASVGISLTGGKAPFTYAWSHVSGQGSVRPINAKDTVAEFYVNGGPPGGVYSQVVQCVVTDATGATLTLQGSVELYFDD